MAEAIVSVVLEQSMKVAGRPIQHEVKLVLGVDDDINNLTSKFQSIQAVLADAEQRQVTDPAVGVWLEKLKDVSYDMDDVLDKWNTVILRRLQMEGAENAHSTKRKVRSCILFPYSGLKQIVLSHDTGSKIKAINDTLDAIVKEKDRYDFKLTTSVEQPRRMKSTSLVDVSKVFGVDEQTQALVSQLLCESSERKNSLHIISIVGMGGIGKTTLAQLAYNNNEVISNFERIWVCVSDPFDELRIAKAINEALGGDNSKLLELESVFQEIQKSILEKKFLLVLDDVWTEDSNKWEPFHNCLRNCLHGSKVLVTTRNQRTANMMESIKTIPIEGLSNEHCWSLFSQLAFFDRSDKEREKLEGIGREIVRKCKGLPLAAKTMGSLLRFKRTRKEWENILYSEMWKLKKFENDVFLPLLLSYYDLLPMVKRCFTYCAMFPKDFIFEKVELIKVWMAQGYLGLDQNEEIEIIGEEYFNSLAMRSFFQEFEKDDDGSILRCKMHDIVHDVAQYLSKNECCMIQVKDLKEGNINVMCEKARQLRFMVAGGDSTLPISICNFKKLRILLSDGDLHASKKVLLKIFDELTCLKALEIGVSFRRIPKEIGRLIHLRYLDLSNSYMLRKLSETLCELYNLQTLKLDRCRNLKELPQGIRKLINLRHLMNRDTDSLRYMPKGMERLIHLRTLNEFHLNRGDYGGKACSLECLNNFGHIESLELHFSGSVSMNKDDEAILEAFQPPPNLQELKIKYYEGPTMSTLRRMTSLTNLRSIVLHFCVKCLLPPLGKLPSLETLSIWKMYSVREVGNEFLGVESGEASSSIIYFPKLKTLRFEWMSNWEVWDFGNEDDTCTIMPSLLTLEMEYCFKLKGLPKELLQKKRPLQNLEIRCCDILEEVYSKGKGDKWQDISHIPNILIN